MKQSKTITKRRAITIICVVAFLGPFVTGPASKIWMPYLASLGPLEQSVLDFVLRAVLSVVLTVSICWLLLRKSRAD